LDPSIVPIFGFVAPAFLLRINGNLNITIDDYMLSKLQEIPLMQTIQLDAQSIITATSNVGSDEEFDEHIKNLNAPPALGNLLQVLIGSMSDEVNISITHPQLGLQGRVIGKGLNLLLKTITKYMSSNTE